MPPYSFSSRVSPFLLLLTGMLVVTVLVSGCQKVSDMKQAAEDASKALEQAQSAVNSQEAGEKMGSAFQKLREATGGGQVVQAVDFRDLKPMLPATIGGMTTDDLKGSRSSQMGMSTSKAEGVYRADDEQSQRLTITVTDTGSMSGLTSIGQRLQGFTESEVESSSGYERSTEIGGYDGREKFRSYDNGRSSGNVTFLVAGRFKVEVDGRNVPMEDIKAAALSVDLAGLAAMKDQGVGVDDGQSEKVAEMYEEFRRAEAEKAAADAAGTAQPVPRAALRTDEMKALFPSQLAGLPRTSVEATSPPSEVSQIVSGEASFQDGDRQLSVGVIDYAGYPSPNGMVPGAMWLMYDVQKESDTGYEKRTTIRGFPALEKLERRSGDTVQCDVQMVVAERFLLSVSALNLSMDEVKAAIATLNPDAMSDMGRTGA